MDVRQAWQFPATQALLSLLTASHSVPATTPTSLEDAIRTSDAPLLAQVHAKLLRLPPSSQHKWRASILRYIANHPQYFDPHIPQPQGDEAYDSTTPYERLLLLHALAEAVLSEHPPEASVEEMRPYPIGSDALKNHYWYFHDAERVYREPGEAARKKAEKEAQAADKQRKAAEDDARRREREEKREAIGKRREEKRKRDAEKWGPRVAVARSTRASRRLQQQADRQNEQNKMDEGVDASGEGDAGKENWLLREIGFSSDEDGEEENAKKRKRQSIQESTPRRSGRRRTRTQLSASPPPKRPRRKHPSPPPPQTPPPPPPPKRKEFADPTLRMCTHWETVSTNADELRAFIARFGAREKLATVERSLLKRLDEILPEMDEAQARAKREADRKAKAQFLLMNQKRSTRVQAIHARREEEARREAEREEREREEAARIAAHQRAVFEAICFLVRDQSRDIRGARREFGMDYAIDRDEVAIRKQEREKALRAAHLAPVRRSARMQRAKRQSEDEKSGTTETGAEVTAHATPETTTEAKVEPAIEATAKAAIEATSEAAAKSTPEATTKTESLTVTGSGTDHGAMPQSVTGSDIRESGTPDAPQPCDGEQVQPAKEENVKTEPSTVEAEPSGQVEEDSKETDLEDRGTTIDFTDVATKSSSEAERSLEHEQKRRRFTSAAHEEDISPAFTWSANGEDKVPMRVLDKFFFATSTNFADAPLEDCEVPESNIVGFGLLIPPTTAPPDVERIEISRIVEWMFEYGGSPKIWIKSEHAWYELREPAVEYQKVFKSARRKFEICARVAIMGDTMRGAQLNYSSILDYLSYPYGEMLAYQDSDVLNEKRYIVSQIELLHKRSLLQSGFIRELHKRIRAENRKAAQEKAKLETHEAALEMKREEEFARMKDEDVVIVSPMKAKVTDGKPTAGAERKASATKAKESKKGSKDKISKRPPRKRSGKPVPRAVSSIINGLLRAATKSYKTPRKRKAISDSGRKTGTPKTVAPTGNGESPKRSTELTGKGIKKNGAVGVVSEDMPIIGNGYHGSGEMTRVCANGGVAPATNQGLLPRYNLPAATGVGASPGSVQPGLQSAVAKSRRPAVKKERRVDGLVPTKMVGHAMSAFVSLPRPLVSEHGLRQGRDKP